MLSNLAVLPRRILGGQLGAILSRAVVQAAFSRVLDYLDLWLAVMGQMARKPFF